MIFQKVILVFFLFICASLIPNNLKAQSIQKVAVEEKKQIEKKKNTMVLQKKKRVLSKTDGEEQRQQIEKRKAIQTIQKKNKLYLSAYRIERAKTDLEKLKKLNKISRKEILQEEKKIKKSEIELKKKTKEVSKFSKKVGQ